MCVSYEIRDLILFSAVEKLVGREIGFNGNLGVYVPFISWVVEKCHPYAM